ncbi:MAG: hypothetical protein ACP5QO_16240 [Clostridia bacterium]
MTAFDDACCFLSRNPSSRWVNTCVLKNREATGRNSLIGLTRRRTDAGGMLSTGLVNVEGYDALPISLKSRSWRTIGVLDGGCGWQWQSQQAWPRGKADT